MNERVDIAALRRERDELRDELERRTEESRTRPVTARRARRPWSSATKMFVVGATLIVIASGALAAVALFSHTFPATPAGPPAVLTTTCTGLIEQTPAPVTGTAGGLRFDCGPLGTTGATALTVATTGSVTPAFTLPAGATGLSLIAHVTTNAQCSGGTALANGVGVPLTAPASLDYCLSYTSYPAAGIASFTVTWSQ